MRTLFVIILKEIKDNLRDRRSLFFALVYGPILMPALMIGPIVFNAGKHSVSYDQPREFHLYGEQYAPNFVAYLKSKNLQPKSIGDDFIEQLENDEAKIVVEISHDYGEDLQSGHPAKIILHYNKQDSESQSLFWHLQSEIDAFSRKTASQRMAIRGFDMTLLQTIKITENDISKEQFGSGALANIILFLVIFSSMMGGFYLAIDCIVGERERNSLEPLMSLPLSPLNLILGKYGVVLLFCTLSTLLPIFSAAIWASFIPDSFFGDSDTPNILTYLKLSLICIPISIFSSSFLMAAATLSKTVKEAQTQMGIAMLFPMIPFFIVQFLDIKSELVLQFAPLIAQYELAGKVLHDRSYPLSDMLSGTLSILSLSAVFLVFAVFMFTQQRKP